MLRGASLGLVVLVASLLVSALRVQVPLEPSDRWRDERPVVPDIDGRAGWSFDELPSPNATDHLVFETVHSLLRHWPNTRMRKGHNIVPGVIPKGTLFYHGTTRRELPPGPGWVAMDPEHALFFCRNHRLTSQPKDEPECWYLTLSTTRPLKIMYFDGSSAAKFPDGSLDAQDLLIWGESRADDVDDEIRRIKDLCEWVMKFDLDGVVRMGMNFEAMICDFTSGVSGVSFLNLGLPKIVREDPMSGLVPFEVMNAGSRHDRFPGETRVQLDLARLISFYDTQLVPSLVPVRASQERWDHRLQDISSNDLAAVKSTVETALTSPWGSPSGIDWKTLIQVMVDRFAQRLELTRHLLNSPATDPEDMIDLTNKTQAQLRVMLTPYILLSAAPTDPLGMGDLRWAKPIYGYCATTHTRPMESELETMTDSERLLFQAVRGTSREICRVVTKMWAAGVYAGVDASLNTKSSLDVAGVAQLRGEWAEDLNRLMAWLDWSTWVKCSVDCGPEGLCYLPTWPAGFPGYPRPHTGGRFALRTDAMKPGADEWIRPQPKCISQVDPYEF